MALAGQNTVVKHGTNGAAAVNTDFSTKVRAVKFSLNGEEVDATTFGNVFRDYEPSFINGTVSVTYKHDPTVFGQVGAIITNRDTITFEIGPDGTGSGSAKLSGSMIPTKFDFDLSVGNLEEYPVEYRITNTVTFGSYA